MAFDTEPTDGRARGSHKGRTWYVIDMHGVTAHASTPWRGADAIAAMAETGREMSCKFKETSLGGLAVSMVAC